MKKAIAWFAALCLLLSAAAALAETQDIFETINGLEWSFSSGVGGWSTEIQIYADGSFTGQYHDSEMGDTGEGYPDGTVYFCSFSGRMTQTAQLDEKTWMLRVEKLEIDAVPEYVEDGIRYIPADAYGVSEGDEMILYAPGTPAEILSEDMQFWAHIIDQENPPTELEDWFLMSEANGSGFVGYPLMDDADLNADG